MSDQPFESKLKPGVKLGKYEVQEQVAVGGMAIIYKGHDPSLDRPVAIKQIAPHLARDERFVERFRDEAKTLARLSSTQANIVNVYEMIEQDDGLFLIMEYVEGTTLRSMMDRGAVPLQTGLGILLSTALGLKAMHAQGIVHRDVTPSNLMMAEDGSLKITDFGLIGHAGGRTSLPMGTTRYMAPEMFTGSAVDPRADIYGLGFIAYEMFVGPEKFADLFSDVLRDEKAQQVRWMHWHSNPSETVPPLKEVQPGIPPLISKIIERMMEKDPDRRFASAEQIVRWLRKIFVMTVKGTSVTQAASEDLEKEIEEDVKRPTTTALAPRGGGSPRRAGGAKRSAPAPQRRRPRPAGGGEGGEDDGGEETADKTAPLPEPTWTWKRAAFWAAVTAGPMILIAVGLLVWSSLSRTALEEEAKKELARARDAYKAEDYDEAVRLLQAFREKPKYDQLDNLEVLAQRRQAQARVLQAMKENNREDFYKLTETADQVGVDPAWVEAKRKKFARDQEIRTALDDVEAALGDGSYESAITTLERLRQDYGSQRLLTEYEVDVQARIDEIRQKVGELGFEQLMTKAREAYAGGEFAEADRYLKQVQRNPALIDFRSDPGYRELLSKIEEAKQYANLVDAGQQAFSGAEEMLAAKEYSAAATAYEDAVAAWQRALGIRSTEKLQRRLEKARVRKLVAEARQLEAADQDQAAMDKWQAVLEIDPDHAQALRRVKEAEMAGKLAALRDKARRAEGDENWAAAADAYQQLVDLLPVGDERRTEYEEKLLDMKFKAKLDDGRRLMAEGEWSEAELALKEARSIRPDAVQPQELLDQLATERSYDLHIKTAEQLLAKDAYLEAREEAQRAQDVKDTQEIRNLLLDIDYERNLATAKRYMQQENWRTALAFFNQARNKKKTPEVEAYIQECTRYLREEEDQG